MRTGELTDATKQGIIRRTLGSLVGQLAGDGRFSTAHVDYYRGLVTFGLREGGQFITATAVVGPLRTVYMLTCGDHHIESATSTWGDLLNVFIKEIV